MEPYKIKSVNKLKKPWTGNINVEGKIISIGVWATKEEAWSAYNSLLESRTKKKNV